MATANYYPRREVNLTEADLERKVGDALYRLRVADVMLNALEVGKTRFYGPLKVKKKEDKFLVAGVDGEMMESIPRADMGEKEMRSILDHKIECSLSEL